MKSAPRSKKRFATKKIDCVDLFCGLGGLTHGLIRGGIDVRAGVDVDGQCQYPYEKNNRSRFIQKDVSELSGDDLIAMCRKPSLKLLAGCAPCQPFSTYSRKSRKLKQDMKWGLVSEFGRLIEEMEPDFVTMENVPQLADHSVFEDFEDSIAGYHSCSSVVDCSEYGVPQSRKRLVLLASRHGPIELKLPEYCGWEKQTVRDAISHLKPIKAGCSDTKDSIHTASSLSELNMQRIKSSKPGGTWRDWDKSLISKCHRKKSGQTFPSVYGRMEWDKPSPTITTQCFGYGNGRFGHPKQNRAISLREAAILQTFPENYSFTAPGEQPVFSVMGRLIGNAVPVRLGEVIAESLFDHISQL